MTIAVTVDLKQFESLKAALKDKAHRLPREIATAINATAKDVRIAVARELRKEINPKVPMKTLKKTIRQKNMATNKKLVAIIGLWKGYPFPMRFFGPRQNRKGVNVRFGRVKGKEGKTFFAGAFVANHRRGNVYRRLATGKGTGKGNTEQLYGPSPGEFFKQAGIHHLGYAVARKQLPIQMQRRIRFLLLKQSGGLRGKKK